MREPLNDTAWQKLFEKYRIAEFLQTNGHFVITADQINEFRQARLMTKFDHRFQLPALFAAHGLSILPITRGSYLLAPMETFADFIENPEIPTEEIFLPPHIESLDFATITSEAMAINCAFVVGILKDFLEEEELLPTINGRMGTDAFSFRVRRSDRHDECLDVNVQNAQMEIDGGYEGYASLNLIEAKNALSSDFLVRQLYYPFRVWQKRVRKEVRPIFLTYTNGTFHLRRYEFTDPLLYNSIQLVREKKYQLKERDRLPLDAQSITTLIQRTPCVEEPKVPFPQADAFERIINLCEILYNEDAHAYSKDALNGNSEFTLQQSFTSRQVDYYVNAALYLGLVEQSPSSLGKANVRLSPFGKNIFATRHLAERQRWLITAILRHKVFRRVFQQYLQLHTMPSKDEVVAIMKTSSLYNVHTETTFRRRASTILSWCTWIRNAMTAT